ncbi:MAG: hypothetical protein ACREFE_20175, partial [Limisphaerales bacterium]
MMRLTPRWSQRRLLLHFAFVCKFTLAVIRAVAQLWIVRPQGSVEIFIELVWLAEIFGGLILRESKSD